MKVRAFRNTPPGSASWCAQLPGRQRPSTRKCACTHACRFTGARVGPSAHRNNARRLLCSPSGGGFFVYERRTRHHRCSDNDDDIPRRPTRLGANTAPALSVCLPPKSNVLAPREGTQLHTRAPPFSRRRMNRTSRSSARNAPSLAGRSETRWPPSHHPPGDIMGRRGGGPGCLFCRVSSADDDTTAAFLFFELFALSSPVLQSSRKRTSSARE